MQHLRYEFLLQAETPIAHHAEVFGNSAILMRRKVRQPAGDFASVPVITGDTMRHGMREAAAYAYLDAAGLLADPSLSEAALRLLFAGGMVTGRGDAGAVKLAAYRQMVDLMPMIALFGGCAGNRVIPGRLTVEDATLICAEEAHLLPEWVNRALTEQGVAVQSCRAYVEEEQRVRMDPTLDPGKRNLLTEGERAGIEGRLLAGETAHAADDAVGREDAKSSMMPRRFERVCRGALFHWRLSAQCWSDLDADTLHVALAAFLYDARVGGKRGTGHGRLRALVGRQIDVRRPAERMETVQPESLGPTVGRLFRSHVSGRAEGIREFLRSVDA